MMLRTAFVPALGLALAACASTALGTSDLDRPLDSETLVELTVAEVHEGLRTRAFTAAELTRATLAHIHVFEERYNAFVSLNPDAVAIAEALDDRLEASGMVGPLHGIPVVLKDNMDYAGQVTTAGYAGFWSATGGIDMIPGDDAEVVERLKEAGAVIVGKTNLPDFAGHGTRSNSSVAGVTLNAYDVDRAPGGSSGGTATAVNAGFALLGLGTETGGSIQNPAAAQGLVGIKPTFGLVPLEGIYPIDATYRDVAGPLARNVREAALVMDVIAGPSEEDLASYASVGKLPEEGFVASLDEGALEGKRFGLVGEGWRDSFLPLDSTTAREYEAAIEVLRAQGAEVVEDPFAGTRFKELYGDRSGVPTVGAHDVMVYLQGLGPEAAFHSREEWEELTGRRFGSRMDADPEPDSANANPERGRRSPRPPARPSATEEGDAFQAWRMEIRALFRGVLEEHELDGLFFPQAGGPIRPLVEDPERPDFNPNNHPELPSNIINDIGLPVVTLPVSYYDDGMPFAVAFIGDMWTDVALTSYAYDLEQATRARTSPVLERAAMTSEAVR